MNPAANSPVTASKMIINPIEPTLKKSPLFRTVVLTVCEVASDVKSCTVDSDVKCDVESVE